MLVNILSTDESEHNSPCLIELICTISMCGMSVYTSHHTDIFLWIRRDGSPFGGAAFLINPPPSKPLVASIGSPASDLCCNTGLLSLWISELISLILCSISASWCCAASFSCGVPMVGRFVAILLVQGISQKSAFEFMLIWITATWATLQVCLPYRKQGL